MVNIEHQHQCSSKAIAYNTSIFYKSRQSYLIIDIEPIVDKSQDSKDQSSSSIFKDYIPYCKYIFLPTSMIYLIIFLALLYD
jgi:hypothetical protein